jgi:hypothetical protein
MYLNSDLLDKEIIISKFKGEATDKYKEYIYLISVKLGSKLNNIFRNNSYDDYDYRMTSYMDGLELWKKIKPGYPGFQYITECMKRSYIKGYNRQRFGKDYLRKDEVNIIYVDFF